ncbi:NAD(P)-dependent oxidoreductase [Candidatus Jidaibacter acanthamoebae]|nr:NAD(P)-dependent oxidoreductase [Candidatus Jidaibacter acanthamoeba]
MSKDKNNTTPYETPKVSRNSRRLQQEGNKTRPLEFNFPNEKEIEDKIKMPQAEKELIRDFYKDVIRRFAGDETENMKDIQFIVVGHVVPTLPFYLEGLKEIGSIAAVIAKGSIADTNIRIWLEETKIANHLIVKGKFKPFQNEDERKELEEKLLKLKENPEEIKSRGLEKFCLESTEVKEWLALDGAFFVNKWAQKDKKIIIIDIGGYFSYTLKDLLTKRSSLNNTLLGIVEDTENGHQKYRKELKEVKKQILSSVIRTEQLKEFNIIKSLPQIKEAIKREYQDKAPPIISVARSQINEDYNVGKAITDATDHILRVEDYTHLAESNTILVIGYGKIGSAAARVASEKTRGPVLICETNQVRKLEASAHSFKVVSIYKGLKQADVVICCTGNKCLDKVHIQFLKNNVYIASCTSRDDEFTKEFLTDLEKHIKESPKLDKEKKEKLDGDKLINYISSYLELHTIIKDKLGDQFLTKLNEYVRQENSKKGKEKDEGELLDFISSSASHTLEKSELSKFLHDLEKGIKELREENKIEIKSHISRYMVGGKTINLLNNGNSVNFVEKAVHGYFIHGVLASLAISSIIIYFNSIEKYKNLNKGQLNDFNELIDLSETSEVRTPSSQELNNKSCQSIIAEILMRHKLRDEPIISNIKIN